MAVSDRQTPLWKVKPVCIGEAVLVVEFDLCVSVLLTIRLLFKVAEHSFAGGQR